MNKKLREVEKRQGMRFEEQSKRLQQFANEASSKYQINLDLDRQAYQISYRSSKPQKSTPKTSRAPSVGSSNFKNQILSQRS